MPDKIPMTVTCQQSEPHAPHQRLWMGIWFVCSGDHVRCVEPNCGEALKPRIPGDVLVCPTHGEPWLDEDGKPAPHPLADRPVKAHVAPLAAPFDESQWQPLGHITEGELKGDFDPPRCGDTHTVASTGEQMVCNIIVKPGGAHAGPHVDGRFEPYEWENRPVWGRAVSDSDPITGTVEVGLKVGPTIGVTSDMIEQAKAEHPPPDPEEAKRVLDALTDTLQKDGAMRPEGARTAGEARQAVEWARYREMREKALREVLEGYETVLPNRGIRAQIAHQLETTMTAFMKEGADLLLNRAIARATAAEEKLDRAERKLEEAQGRIRLLQQADETGAAIVDANEEMGNELVRLARWIAGTELGVEGAQIEGEKIVDTAMRIIKAQACEIDTLGGVRALLQGALSTTRGQLDELTRVNNQQERDRRAYLEARRLEVLAAREDADHQRAAKRKWKARAGNWARSVQYWREKAEAATQASQPVGPILNRSAINEAYHRGLQDGRSGG